MICNYSKCDLPISRHGTKYCSCHHAALARWEDPLYKDKIHTLEKQKKMRKGHKRYYVEKSLKKEDKLIKKVQKEVRKGITAH